LALGGKTIPIVYITAHGGASLRSRLIAGGAVECLSKPFSDTALREALNSAFRTG
jgi:FixJ family two-component response regulator